MRKTAVVKQRWQETRKNYRQKYIRDREWFIRDMNCRNDDRQNVEARRYVK